MINKTKSIYARKFDSSSPYWDRNPEYNEIFIKTAETYFNTLLKARGYVFLRDVYDRFGIPIDAKSIVVGWFYDSGNAFVDNCIRIDIEKADEDSSFILDFNVDGNILDHFD